MKRPKDASGDVGAASGRIDWLTMLACSVIGLLAGYGASRVLGSDGTKHETSTTEQVIADRRTKGGERGGNGEGSFSASETELRRGARQEQIQEQFRAGVQQVRAAGDKPTVWLPRELTKGFSWSIGSMHEEAFFLNKEATEVLNLSDAEQAEIKERVADFYALIKATEKKVAVYEENSDTRVKLKIPKGVDMAEPLATFTNQMNQALGEVRSALLLEVLQKELNEDTPLFLNEEWEIEVEMLPGDRFQVTTRSGGSWGQSLTSELPDKIEHLVKVEEGAE